MPKKKSVKKSSQRASIESSPTTKQNTLLGLELKTWIGSARKSRGTETRTGKRGFLIALGHKDVKAVKAALRGHVNKWQNEWLVKNDGETILIQGLQGPVWLLQPVAKINSEEHDASHALDKTSYARFRDLAGGIVSQVRSFGLDRLVLDFHDLDLEEERGILVGLEMASYNYLDHRPTGKKVIKRLPSLVIKSSSSDLNDHEIKAASKLALSVNIARHYVNLPAGDLNPKTYSESIERLFSGSDTVSVDTWTGDRLAKENMGLLMAVGGAAEHGPRFVHMRYRPKGLAKDARPLALVGKGVTFDSGGLDIKPSSGMRLMKKDMGGSAAVVAIMKWAELTGLKIPLDGYVSLAENAIGSRAFRPGDVVTARNGLGIEIHNTDAEGRLVLADALDVAVTQEGADRPSAVINFATLTGAIKVGLGAEIAGLFSNNDSLAQALEEAGRAKGDLSWRMPLYQPYKSMLRSSHGDYSNASESGFAGAITAALFLELFVKDVPWAHLDIYSWKDSPGGAWSEAGGNGQPVQAMAEFLSRMDTGAE